ncbi:MAG: hypothetical protein ACTHN3_03135 [Solirubrobacterales bacterium]
MTARGRLLFLVCVVALSALPASASAATGKAAEVKLSSFELTGSDGYEIEVAVASAGRRAPMAEVDVRRGPLSADYAVKTASGAGLQATFGSLGQLDVHFARRGKKEVLRPEPGCRWVTEHGVFRGSFHFAGEDGYVSAEATDPAGEVLRLPNGFCGLGDDRRARPSIPGLLSETVLAARSTRGGREVTFEASHLESVRVTLFHASLRERAEGMTITRTAHAQGPKSSFSSAGSAKATVAPPSPFEGSARFRDPAGGPPSWTGSLSVSFLGAPETALAGEGFTARLCPRSPILSVCLR